MLMAVLVVKNMMYCLEGILEVISFSNQCEEKKTAPDREFPARCCLILSVSFPVWVTVWVKQKAKKQSCPKSCEKQKKTARIAKFRR